MRQLKHYSKLRGRIKEMFGTQREFADAMKMDQATLSARLNKKIPWTCDEIVRACSLLEVALQDAAEYFFCEQGLEIQTY